MADPTKPNAFASPAKQPERAIVFLSYAREDKNFVLRLTEAFQLKGVEVRGDWQLIRGENYQVQLRDLQLNADTVVFVISPDSVSSMPCRMELELAAEQKKRILPVVCRDVGPLASNLPPALSLPQWTFLRGEDDFIAGAQALVQAINTDFDLMPEHRRLLQEAEIWERNERSSSYLLRKDGLRRAEDWLTKTGVDANKLPKPTALQLEYIQASRSAQTRGSRIAIVLVAAVAITMAALAVVALIQRHQAKIEQGNAENQAVEARKQKRIAEQQTVVAKQEADEARRQQGVAIDARHRTELQRRVNTWQSAARQATSDFASHSDDDRSALLAIQSLLLHKSTPNQPGMVVERALQSALGSSPFTHVLGSFQRPATKIDFSVDGTFLAATDAYEVRVWDLSKGTPHELSIPIPGDAFTFSSDGHHVAVRQNGAWVLCDLHQPNARPHEILSAHSHSWLPTFSPDGDFVAAASGEKLLLWDLRQPDRNPEELLVLPSKQGSFFSIAFSPDGEKLAASAKESGTIAPLSDDYTVRIWNLKTRDALSSVPAGYKGPVYSLAFSRDGNQLAALCYDRKVRIWDLRHREAVPAESEGVHADLLSIAFIDGDKELAAAVSDGTILVWDLPNHVGETPSVLASPKVVAEAVAFSRDGKRIALVGGDQIVRLWDLRSSASPQRTLSNNVASALDRPVFEIAIAPDGTRLAALSNDGVRVWRLNQLDLTPLLLQTHSPVRSLAFSPDGNLIALAGDDRIVHVWNLQQPNKEPLQLQGNGFDVVPAAGGVGFSVDGRRLYSVSDSIRIWDLRLPSANPLVLPRRYGRGALLSRDWTHVVSYQKQHASDPAMELSVWDLRKPKSPPAVLRSEAWGGMSDIALSFDGDLLAESDYNGTLNLWDLSRNSLSNVLFCERKETRSTNPAPTFMRQPTAFSRDGTLVAMRGYAGNVCLWDLTDPNRDPIFVLPAEFGVNSIAFSPGGDLLAWADYGGVKLWPLSKAAADYLCNDVVWRNLSKKEWDFYIGKDIPYQPTCPNLPPGEGASNKQGVAIKLGSAV